MELCFKVTRLCRYRPDHGCPLQKELLTSELIVNSGRQNMCLSFSCEWLVKGGHSICPKTGFKQLYYTTESLDSSSSKDWSNKNILAGFSTLTFIPWSVLIDFFLYFSFLFNQKNQLLITAVKLFEMSRQSNNYKHCWLDFTWYHFIKATWFHSLQ